MGPDQELTSWTSDCTGQTAWISGAASGIGAATARLFAEEGANVALVDVNVHQGGARAMAAERGDAIGRSSSRPTCRCEDAGPRVAGGGGRAIRRPEHPRQLRRASSHVKALHEYHEADWDRLMGVNLKGIFFSVKHGLHYLKRKPRSYVVNVGSISSFVGQAATPAYTASKSAVLGLSQSIALDYARSALRCNCVCPGITDTPMLREHLDQTPDPEATLAERLRRVPMRVPLSPRDIAKAILYLSCEDSAGVTGTSLVVDGGYLAAAEWDAG